MKSKHQQQNSASSGPEPGTASPPECTAFDELSLVLPYICAF